MKRDFAIVIKSPQAQTERRPVLFLKNLMINPHLTTLFMLRKQIDSIFCRVENMFLFFFFFKYMKFSIFFFLFLIVNNMV